MDAAVRHSAFITRVLLCWQVLWDVEDPTLFVASNSKGQLFTYLLTQQSMSGQKLELLAAQSLPVGHKPVLLADGWLSVRLKSGAVDTWVLETHKPLLEQGSDSKQLHKKWVQVALTVSPAHTAASSQLLCWFSVVCMSTQFKGAIPFSKPVQHTPLLLLLH
jgi:hypothetical protein